jgi:hypothetical protein
VKRDWMHLMYIDIFVGSCESRCTLMYIDRQLCESRCTLNRCTLMYIDRQL